MTKKIYTTKQDDKQDVKEKYIIFADITNLNLEATDSVVRYASRTLRRELGDEVEIDEVRLKLPGLSKRIVYKIRHQPPQARLYVTTKF